VTAFVPPLCRYVIAKKSHGTVVIAIAETWVNAMGDENIVETITEEIAEAAKAVVAEIKSIATEVTEAVESTATLCDEEKAASKDDAAAEPAKDSGAPR
jgi:hypothetical protein